MPEKIKIYTDGGCTGNPGPGAWAAVILADDQVEEEISGGEMSTTNNRMELTAVIKALEKIKGFRGPITVLTDSQYVQKGISEWMKSWIAKGWRTAAGKPVKNKDLWIPLRELNESMNVNWEWVRGHAGNTWNERCDQLVAMERERLKNY